MDHTRTYGIDTSRITRNPEFLAWVERKGSTVNKELDLAQREADAARKRAQEEETAAVAAAAVAAEKRKRPRNSLLNLLNGGKKKDNKKKLQGKPKEEHLEVLKKIRVNLNLP